MRKKNKPNHTYHMAIDAMTRSGFEVVAAPTKEDKRCILLRRGVIMLVDFRGQVCLSAESAPQNVQEWFDNNKGMFMRKDSFPDYVSRWAMSNNIPLGLE